MKTYGDLHVPWHTHLYRSGLAVFVKSDRPWHTHLYRGLLSLFGHGKYSPPSASQLLATIAHKVQSANLHTDTGTLAAELKRLRNRSNKTVLRHVANLAIPAGRVQTSHGFDHITGSLRPIVAKRSADIVVCTVALGDRYRKIIGECLRSHAAYCERNGYSYADLCIPPNWAQRHGAWYKIPLVHHLLQLGYSHVLYLDADCLVTNPSFRLETLIEKLERASPPRSMLLSEDDAGINTGCFLVRDSAPAVRLLDSIWLYDADIHHNNWEQQALKHLLDDHEEFLDALLIEKNGKLFNSVPHERQEFHRSIVSPAHVWTPGDFICHFSGIRSPHLEKLIDQYAGETASP